MRDGSLSLSAEDKSVCCADDNVAAAPSVSSAMLLSPISMVVLVGVHSYYKLYSVREICTAVL